MYLVSRVLENGGGREVDVKRTSSGRRGLKITSLRITVKVLRDPPYTMYTGFHL